MIGLPGIPELGLYGVADAGVPNKERILIRPRIRTQLQGYMLAIGAVRRTPDIGTFVIPIANYVFYFPEVWVEPDSWVVVYTGRGEARQTRLPTTLEVAYSFHWGYQFVLFTSADLVPVVYQISGMETPPTVFQTKLELPNPYLPSLSGPAG